MRIRRATAGLAVAAASLAALAGCAGFSTTTVADQEFVTELAIPPLAPSSVEDGVRTFHLTAQEASTSFAGVDEPTTTWGFDGSFLGPTLRAQRGERVAVEVDNRLPERTSVHWHGMHLPAAMDGGPHQMIEQGETWRPTWTIDQPAATLWYHPHPHGETEKHVYLGLAGMFLLDDDASLAADLPREYGVDDLPLIVQDKEFDDRGQLVLRQDGAEPGMLGDTVMVNGTIGAFHDVTTERVRLRLLNGSTARTYTFAFDDRPLTMVASDGGLLDAPIERDALRLAPGERAEVVVSFEPGETVRLRSVVTDLGGVLVPATSGGNDEFDVLEFRAADELTPSEEPSWPAARDAASDELHESAASVTRSFTLNTRSINGEEMDMSRIDEVAYVGDTEIWEVRSTQAIPHSFHVHDVQFRVLSVDGREPPDELAGRKDTIYLQPNTVYRLLLRFDDYADPEMPYMYHCHMLLHEDEGMIGQFVVIERGQEEQVRARDHDEHGPQGGSGSPGEHAH
ncbi:multicopper oxidase family protein [Microbacterium sp. CIAB417]|uniref:multicopper oxidase family protein n=1 Tax=Microbacterium sp. CIAB417 TaxID=2860287 RepID=UPI001FADF303|nr:multicopper oxidase domain-containing protein [Microbacterium sp. CIAB417]